jgi:DtxR family Mn-dependent transcriptional regulator
MYPDPRVALAVFGLLSALTLAVLWPRRGIAARIRRLRRISQQVRLEDTLKYLFHRGAEGEDVRADALAGALQVRQQFARELLERLTAIGLAEIVGTAGHRLTSPGRVEALRIVRSHRILEHYLADRTGLGPAEWHEVAEEEEHRMTADEVEALAERLGQPRFDPHGDPIPTAEGELPASEEMLLPALAPGEAGVIVHLEDEPAESYEQLVAMGFALGKTVLVRSRSASVASVELDGRAHVLTRALELAVNVERADAARGPVRTLADLEQGATGRVLRLTSECRGAQRRRLLDLGVVPGTVIGAEMRSASGDPTAYRIRGALIALRRQQAEWVELEASA